MSSWIDLHALWKIVVLSLACGAGLPAVFAIGLRALQLGEPTGRSDGGERVATANTANTVNTVDTVTTAKPVALAAAGFCFAIVLAAVGWGIYLIVAAS